MLLPFHISVNIRRAILITCLLLLFSCSTSHKIRSINENKFANEWKRELKAGETHLYNIRLKEEEMLHMIAEQIDMDVIIKISDSSRGITAIFDSPNGEIGAEDIYLLSNATADYKIELYPAQKYADPGKYVLKVVRLDKAKETDKKWMDALNATQEADKMRTKTETRQQSISQYETAMSAWLAVNDTMQYAKAKRSMGFVHIRLRNYVKAVETFTQLLPIWKQLGDTRAEGFTLLIIGRIYDLQKDYKTSLDYNLRSLPYWIAANDRDQQSFTLMNIGNLYSYLGDKKQTDESFAQSLKINEISGRPSIKAVILRDYANSLRRLKEDEKAIRLYDQSLKQWQVTSNTPEEARTALLMAAYYSERSKRKEAVSYYQHALAIWQKLKDEAEIKKVEEALAKLEK